MTDDEDNATCENCSADGPPAGVEIRGAYDGVLYWLCPLCGHAWPRFTVGRGDSPARAALSADYAARHNGQRPVGS